jgi:hypothetical protein
MNVRKMQVAWVAGVLATLTISTALAQPGSGRRTMTEPAEWVPENAIAYLGITDVDRMWSNFKKTAAYRMAQEDAVGTSAGAVNLGEIIKKFKTRVAQVLDIPPSQIESPFGGGFALYAVLPPGTAPEDMDGVVVAGVGDEERMQRYYDAALAKLKQNGRVESKSAAGVTIDVFTADPDRTAATDDEAADEEFDMGGNGPFDQFSPAMVDDALDKLFAPDSLPDSLAMCLTDDQRLVLGSSEDAVRGALRVEKRESLAQTADHEALLRHLKRPGTVRFLVNIPRIIEVARAEAEGADAAEFRQGLQIIGAGSLRSLVGHLRMGASAYDSKAEMLFLMQGERSGLAEVLSMNNMDTAPPDSVSASAAAYLGINLNVPQLLDRIERMIRANDPAMADQMRASLESMPTPDGSTINIRKELIDHLVGPLTLSLSIKKPYGAENIITLFRLGHRDQNAVVRALSNPALTQGMLQPREVRGTPVFDALFPPMSVAVTGDALVQGSMAAVEQALESRAGEPLAQTEAWKRAARFVPERSWFVLFVDNRQLTEAALALADQPGALAGAMDLGSLLMNFMIEGMKASGGGDLAQQRAALKYAAPTVMTISTTDEGLHFSAVTLNPEE